MQITQNQDCLHIRKNHLITSHKGKGSTTSGTAVHSGVSDPLLLWESIHRKNNQEVRDQIEGAQGCMLQGLYQQVCHGEPYMYVDRTAPYQVEGDNVFDHAKGHKELLLKEALHIRAAPEGSHFN